MRFATENFSGEEENLKNPFVHLTNYAVNRGNKENQEEKGKFFSRGLWVSILKLHQNISCILRDWFWSIRFIYKQIHTLKSKIEKLFFRCLTT